jgi:hypothetical protein
MITAYFSKLAQTFSITCLDGREDPEQQGYFLPEGFLRIKKGDNRSARLIGAQSEADRQVGEKLILAAKFLASNEKRNDAAYELNVADDGTLVMREAGSEGPWTQIRSTEPTVVTGQ